MFRHIFSGLRHRAAQLGVAAAGMMLSGMSASADALIDVNREIGLAVSGEYLNYHEYKATGAEEDGNVGWTPGVSAKAQFLGDEFGAHNLYAGIFYQFNSGDVVQSDPVSPANPKGVHYHGGLTMNDIVVETGTSYEYGNLSVIPIIEIEYRNWLRTIQLAAIHPQENYIFFAPGAGIRADYALAPNLVLRTKFGAEEEFNPRLDGAPNPPNHIPTETLWPGSEPVWQIILGTDYRFTDELHFFTEADCSILSFGASAGVSLGNSQFEHEPHSKTDDVRLLIGFAWAY